MTKNVPDKTYLFEEAPIPKAVLSFAVPTIITQLINVVYNYADTWYVGRTGNAGAVAAMSVTFPIFVILSALANLFGVGGASLISRLLGQKKPEEARGVFAFSLYGGLASALLYMIVIAFFRTPLIYAIGGDENSFSYAYDYMFYTMVLGAVPTLGNVLLGHLIRSFGASKEAGIGMSLGGILNIALDPLFMFVLLPKGMEVTGAAIATMISNTASFLYFVIYLLRHRDHPVFTIRPSEISFRNGIPGQVLTIGFPAALQTSLAMVSNILANVFMRGYGTAAVSGLGVAKKINMIAFNTTMGFTIGVSPLVGYNYGSGNFKRMKQAILFTGVIAFSFNLLCLGVFYVFSQDLVRFFINEPESIAYGSGILKIICFAAPLAVITFLINAVFQSAGRRTTSLLLSTMRKGVVDIPLMALFAFAFGMEARGVALATPAAEIISSSAAIVLFVRFLKSLDRKVAESNGKELSK